MDEVGFFLVLALGVLWCILSLRRARRMVLRWASERSLTIVKWHRTWFRMSPWPLVAFGHQTVRYVSVRDAEGRVHRCWLLLGSFWLGLTDRIVERWEG